MNEKYDPKKYWNQREDPNLPGSGPPVRLMQYVSENIAGQKWIFELGPGVGRTFDIYDSSHEIATLDLSRRYYSRLETIASERNLSVSQHFLDAPDEAFPFPDKSFDAAVCVQVLLHVPPAYIRHTMSELSRVSRKAVIVSVVDEEWLVTSPKHCFHHDYLRLCGNIGCVADNAYIEGKSIFFVLRES